MPRRASACKKADGTFAPRSAKTQPRGIGPEVRSVIAFRDFLRAVRGRMKRCYVAVPATCSLPAEVSTIRFTQGVDCMIHW